MPCRPTHAALLAALIALGVSPAQADDAEMLAASRQAAGQLLQRLGAELRAELAKGGPDGAVAVCKQIAPDIAGDISRRNGWRVARVSLRTRNPMLGQPDAWEQNVLAEFDRRAAAGEKPDQIEFAQTVDEPQGRYYRYMKAIPVQPLCLTCHGTESVIPESVSARLTAEYPHDRAVGYAPGQIRGAVTIKRLLP
jgi:hypothetical protein